MTITLLSHLTTLGKFWGKCLLLYKTVMPMRLLSWVILTLILSADFGEKLIYFAADNALQISDGIITWVPVWFFSHILAWLDHVVCSGTAHRHVLSCDTLDDITFGDHIPVQIVYYFKQGDHVKKNHQWWGWRQRSSRKMEFYLGWSKSYSIKN